MRKLLCILICAAVILSGCSSSKKPTENAPKLTDKYVSDVYPTKPVKFIVPFSEGGGTDLVARALVDAASDSFPQGVSVENIVGDGGATGMLEGANADPDGSVVTTITVELTTVPNTNKDCELYYDQFKPILMVNSAYSAITVDINSEYDSLTEFIEASKVKKLKIGNSGVGAIWHLASAGLAKAAGTEFEDVPYDGGSKDAIAALENGDIDAVSVSYSEVAAEVNAGNLKVLAILSPKRVEEVPDIPTAIELGYDVSIGTWRGFGVPKDTPDEIADELSYILSKAAGSIDFVEYMIGTGNVIEILDSKDYGERIAKDNEMFKQLINDLGLSK